MLCEIRQMCCERTREYAVKWFFGLTAIIHKGLILTPLSPITTVHRLCWCMHITHYTLIATNRADYMRAGRRRLMPSLPLNVHLNIYIYVRTSCILFIHNFIDTESSACIMHDGHFTNSSTKFIFILKMYTMPSWCCSLSHCKSWAQLFRVVHKNARREE